MSSHVHVRHNHLERSISVRQLGLVLRNCHCSIGHFFFFLLSRLVSSRPLSSVFVSQIQSKCSNPIQRTKGSVHCKKAFSAVLLMKSILQFCCNWCCCLHWPLEELLLLRNNYFSRWSSLLNHAYSCHKFHKERWMVWHLCVFYLFSSAIFPVWLYSVCIKCLTWSSGLNSLEFQYSQDLIISVFGQSCKSWFMFIFSKCNLGNLFKINCKQKCSKSCGNTDRDVYYAHTAKLDGYHED